MINLVDILIKKLSQTMPDPMDPNAVQQGQSVYDPTGEEFIVLEDDPTTTNKVIMPADDMGKPVPEGATTVEDYEFSTNYQVQPTDQVSAAIEQEFYKGKLEKSN